MYLWRDPRGGGSCVFMRVARTGPPRAYPGAWLEGAGLARTAPRSRLTAPWPPAAATSRAVHTCSLLERLAGMESEGAGPGPRTAPPAARPRRFAAACAWRATVRMPPAFALTVMDLPVRALI